MKKKDRKMLEELLLKERERLIEKIKMRHHDDFIKGTTKFSDNTAMDDVDICDIGTDVYNKEFSAMMLDRDNSTLKKVDDALLKLKEGTYGICKKCGKEISLPRLKALLYTNYCAECKREKEKVST